jgi:D-amino-acid dehydrogenase
VIGAGVVGVTTAYELTQDGHEVTVFERHNTAAEGASFANGGLIAPEWIATCAAADWKSNQTTGLIALWRTIRAGKAPRYTSPAAGLLGLARYSNERLIELNERHQLELDSHQGMMIVWQSEREAALARSMQTEIREMGGESALVDATEARNLEPALNTEAPLHSALVLSGAWSANCRQFTLQLKALAQQRGCRFEFGSVVHGLQTGNGVHVMSSGSTSTTQGFDGVVLCAGPASAEFLSSIGLQAPLHSLVGHSISAAVREPLDAPLSVVYDLRRQVTMARMGQRVRVSSVARASHGTEKSPAEIKKLYAALNDWFPGAIRLGGAANVQEWSSTVAVTPDGLPMLGHTGRPGVWLNLGHGMHGWTMACGSARVIADQVAGQSPAVELAPYSPMRYNH